MTERLTPTIEQPRCCVCLLRPEDLDEYTEAAADCDLTPDEYLRAEEGTFNPKSGGFVCTPCYVLIGCPSGPVGGPGWTAP